MDGWLQKCFENLSQEAKELYLFNDIPCLNDTPDPLEFHRDWISPNRPVIIKNASIQKWPALQRWSVDYFRRKIGNKIVTVAVTPNGLADAVCNGYFVTPHEERMQMSAFLDMLTTDPDHGKGIYYIQKQNSNFIEEFHELWRDVDGHIAWMSQALGKRPDAVNFWMGDQRAITSMHKDHYENIYCVVSGYKDFILHPPTDLPWIPYEKYPAAQWYRKDDGHFDIKPLENVDKVPWIPLDPLKPDVTKFPKYKKATTFRCRIHSGEMLYLPSLWFHHVQQSHGCIAVNYWYDMEYDIKYNYYKLMEMLLEKNATDGS